MLNERISINPKIMQGKPCVKGTRIPVYAVLDLLTAGTTPEQIISPDFFPDLTLEDIHACIAFANQLVKSEDIRFYEDLTA